MWLKKGKGLNSPIFRGPPRHSATVILAVVATREGLAKGHRDEIDIGVTAAPGIS